MSKNLDLWLIRHGESTTNTGLWTDNPLAAPLTARGHEQAAAAAQKVTEPPALIIHSPAVRAEQSASYIRELWPQVPTRVWPIEEIIYLSAAKIQNLNQEARKQYIQDYWNRADPFYCDGSDCESFATFLQRVHCFSEQVKTLSGLVIAVGHGQFFKAYLLSLQNELVATPEGMRFFRQQETTHPLANSEIIHINNPE
ncbi:MAG: hypothetical protein BGO90_07100 [Legionella sp. 40-6]|nr:histidine phosphatase family protein [Legionella sp.]OJY16657.1 MAG: hypothetical protein BGO90_07100 [Legionella sp. 40-6]